MATSDMHIRDMIEADAAALAQAFAAQGWHKPQAQFETYLAEQRTGTRTVVVAESGGTPAGYLTICWRAEYPYRPGQTLAEIRDFHVLQRFQRRGIGTLLMDEAERRVARLHDELGIGVGLHPGYGPAQRLYVLRGYVPDGRGVEYRGRIAGAGEAVANDDTLILRLVKRLRSATTPRTASGWHQPCTPRGVLSYTVISRGPTIASGSATGASALPRGGARAARSRRRGTRHGPGRAARRPPP